MPKDLNKVSTIFQFCDGGSCKRNGCEELTIQAREYIKEIGEVEQVHTIKTRCTGQCDLGPIWIVLPENRWYKQMNIEKGKKLIKEQLAKAKKEEPPFVWEEDMLASAI